MVQSSDETKHYNCDHDRNNEEELDLVNIILVIALALVVLILKLPTSCVANFFDVVKNANQYDIHDDGQDLAALNHG